MNENSEKIVKIVDNTRWKERHQFVLSTNGNIICQRYFKVNGFNPNALHSVELYNTMRDIVSMIKDDLASKSRIYTAVTGNKYSKLTGFYNGEQPLEFNDAIIAYCETIDGDVKLSNGTVLHKSFIELPINEEENDDTPFEFKFSYLFDDEVMFEEVWDGTVYPRYVRNSVDLSNSNASYKYADPMRMTFSQQMTKHLTEGRQDLIYQIIKSFCEALSNNIDKDGNTYENDYIIEETYGDKTYLWNPYPKKYVKAWADAVRQKTIQYKRWVDNDYPQSKIDYWNSL